METVCAGDSSPLEIEGLSQPVAVDTQENVLGAIDLTLVTPGGEAFLDKASFRWEAGDRVCLLGPAGCGKSALLRALAGAWPPPAAGAVIPGHVGAGILLVTGAGFLLPPRATLRECLAYPEAISVFDEDLQEAFTRCGLDRLALQLDVKADWTTALSISDRQRLVFARLSARWPAGVRWLLLDEADSALDGATALALQDLVTSKVPEGAGVVVASKHMQVTDRPGWCRFHLDPELKVLVPEAPSHDAGTGETPPSQLDYAAATGAL